MNNLRKIAVMLLIGVMTLGMFGVVPHRPMAQSQVATPDNSSPDVSTPQTVMDNWEEYLDESRLDGVLDSVLASYKETGVAPDKVATNADGDVGVLVVVNDGADLAALENLVQVNWKADFKVATVVSAYVDSADALTELESFEGVASVFADQTYRDTGSDLSARPDLEQPRDSEPQMYEVKDLVGGDYAYGEGYDGTDIRVGVVDTGVDFSHPDLYDAVDIDETGMPTSYDPSGFAEGLTLYRVNATNVENVTAYLEASSWNLLSYEKDGKYYVNTTGWDPYVNYQGSVVTLDWFFEAYLGAWYPDGYPAESNLTDYYYNVLRQDMELPDPSLTQANSFFYNWTNTDNDTIPYYCTGYVMQQRYTPYAKMFAPALVLNGETGQKLIIDWNTTVAHTQFWNLNIYAELMYFNETSSWDYFNDLGDWSFVDDLDDDWWYNTTGGTIDNKHVVVAWDEDDDGIVDFGLGVLAHVWDPIFGIGMVDGIGLGGRLVGIMYDDDSHGTACASLIAGRGVLDHPVGFNGTSEKLYGIANQSTVLGISTVGLGTQFGANMWVAGFDYNSTSGFFEWNVNSTHKMNMTSNSWGWIADQNYEFYGFASLVYLALSTPGYFGSEYPGMLYAFSSGNSGPGFATTTPPSAASILHVGASTANHYYQDTYGPGQGADQIASFSSRGPLFSGYSKPDVVAPGAYGYAVHPYYSDYAWGMYDDPIWGTTPYQGFGGTSMACPVTVGVAALVAQAATELGDPEPSDIKTSIQSSAKDLGYDGFTQGHGRVDAQGAIDYIKAVDTDLTDGVWWYNTDSSSNYVDSVQSAWAAWMDPYAEDILIEDAAPDGHKDSSLFYGSLAPGDTSNISLTGQFAGGTYVSTADFATIEARQYQINTMYSDVWETWIYNESVSMGHNTTKAGYFDLSEEMSASEWSDFESATYATIVISGDYATFDNNDDLWSFVFDWDDKNANDVPDYYNTSTEEGDELTRIQFGGSGSNVIKMDLAHPDGLTNLFQNTSIVSIHDDTIWEWPYDGGNELNVSIMIWEETNAVDAASFDFGDDTDSIWANLTVGADADPGIHHGFIVFDDTAETGYVKKLPYSYHVTTAIDTSKGEELLVADGYGDVWTPYEHGTAVGPWDTYYGESSADHFTYMVDVTNTSAEYLGAKVTWEGADTEFEVAIVSMEGMVMADSAGAIKPSDTSSSAVASIDSTGLYAVFVNTLSMEGDPMPQNFTVNVMCYEEIPEPSLSLYWTARDKLGYDSITEGGTAEGDHVVMNATWADATLANMPDYEITSLEMKILKGMLFESTGNELVIPDSGYDPFSGAIDLDQFAWVEVPDINAGDPVRVTVDFTNGDCDIMAWWKDTDNSSWTYGNNVLEDQMATGDKPEKGEFEADRDGTLMIGVFNYDGQPGTFDVKVDTRVGLEPDRAYVKSFEIDTYYLLANDEFSVLIDSDTGTNIDYSLEIPDITINNFFAPVVENVTVTGDVVKTIEWDATDRNADDALYYEVLVSADEGETYQLLAKDLNETTYEWDSDGFEELDTYMIQIRCFDNDEAIDRATYELPATYWPGFETRAYSSSFSAGNVETEPPTTTTTTTTTPPEEPLIPVWLLGLVAGVGVGVVVVLILFLVKRK